MPLYTPLYPLTIRDHVLGLYAVLVPCHAPLWCAVMDLAMFLNTVLGLFQDKRKLPWEQQQQEEEKDLEAAPCHAAPHHAFLHHGGTSHAFLHHARPRHTSLQRAGPRHVSLCSDGPLHIQEEEWGR